MSRSNSRVAILIPAYNEGKYLREFLTGLLKEVNKYAEIRKVIVIDDGSTDTTQEILNTFRKNQLIRIIRLPKNQGKGAALNFGIDAVKKDHCDGYIFMDADNQHDPVYIGKFLDSLRHNVIVFGYRELGSNVPVIRKLGNNIARFIFRTFFHIKRRDLLCGYMAFRKEALGKLSWNSRGYGLETELSAIVGMKRLPFEEVKISTVYYDTKKGVNILHAFFIFTQIPFWYLKYDRSKMYLLASLIIVFLSFFLLAYKNPFSGRNLIPNLEPYPDSFYYATPAWNLVHGHGFDMSFEHYSVKQVVPPLYSLFLIPVFLVFRDVRSFYFLNFALMLGSIFILALTIKKFFGKTPTDYIIITTLLFLFASNFYIYTIPAYLLAENITMFLITFGIYLLLSGVSLATSTIAGVTGVSFWLIKFSNLPLGIAFYTLYVLKLLRLENRKYLYRFLTTSLLSVVVFGLYTYSSKVFADHKNLKTGASFSLKYVPQNVGFYIGNLLGLKSQFLWFSEKMLSPLVSLLAAAGIVAGLFRRDRRSIVLQILIFFVSLIGFMSLFYVQDTRFILALYPLVIVLAAVFFSTVSKRSEAAAAIIAVAAAASILWLRPLNQNPGERMATSFKRQVGLNFKYTEDPWYYRAVMNFNTFTVDKNKSDTYIGTVLPPFLVYYYSNGNYQYLPLSMNQDFFPEKGGLTEQMKIHTVADYYRELLLSGKNVYISGIFSNNLPQWQKEYSVISQTFNARLVRKGCLGECDIYELSLK